MIRPNLELARARARARERIRNRPPCKEDVISTWRRILHVSDYMQLSEDACLLNVIGGAIDRAKQFGPLFSQEEADTLAELADLQYDANAIAVRQLAGNQSDIEILQDVATLFIEAEVRFSENSAVIEAGMKSPATDWWPAAWPPAWLA